MKTLKAKAKPKAKALADDVVVDADAKPPVEGHTAVSEKQAADLAKWKEEVVAQQEPLKALEAELDLADNTTWVGFLPGCFTLKVKAFSLKLQGVLDDLDGAIESNSGESKKLSSSWKTMKKDVEELLRSEVREAKKASCE